jgi:hypothetical protein
LITGEFGLGVLRIRTVWTRNWPAAGKTDSIFVREEGDRVVVVLAVVVVPVEPAAARDGSTTAAANPAAATRPATMRAGRLT